MCCLSIQIFSLVTEESESTDKIPEEETGCTSKSESPKTKENEEEDKSISAPLVLSQERSEEVGRRLRTLEEQIKRLQVNSRRWMTILEKEQTV